MSRHDPVGPHPGAVPATTDYPVTFMMFDVFGFGKPLDHTPLMSLHGVQLGTWGPPVRYGRPRRSASSSTRSARPTTAGSPTATLEVAGGVIEAGTVGADPHGDHRRGRRPRRHRHRARQPHGPRHRPRLADGRRATAPTASSSTATPSITCELTRRRPSDGQRRRHGGDDDAHRERRPRRVSPPRPASSARSTSRSRSPATPSRQHCPDTVQQRRERLGVLARRGVAGVDVERPREPPRRRSAALAGPASGACSAVHRTHVHVTVSGTPAHEMHSNISAIESMAWAMRGSRSGRSPSGNGGSSSSGTEVGGT